MKFIKFDWKMWFFACGLSSVLLVIIDLFTGIVKLNQSLLDVFIFLFFNNLFSSSLNWLYGKVGKIRSYIVIYGITIVLVFIQRTIIDIVRNDAIHWVRNLVMVGVVLIWIVIILAMYELICYFRNKNMNRKLKEYQDKNKDNE